MRLVHIFSLSIVSLILSGCFSESHENKNSLNQSDISKSIAVIGDYGAGNTSEKLVADLVYKMDAEKIITVGDNVYTDAGYEVLVEPYYSTYLNRNTFFPATGNHDYEEGIENYDRFFGFKNNQRFYSVSQLDIDFFILDSQEMLDSPTKLNRQLDWLVNQSSASDAKFKVVVLHHPPYSSSSHHGSTELLQFDYRSMDIDLVLSGHDHTYERLIDNGVTFIVNGAGGKDLYECGSRLPQSVVCSDVHHGALFLTTSSATLIGEFINSDGEKVDRFEINTSG